MWIQTQIPTISFKVSSHLSLLWILVVSSLCLSKFGSDDIAEELPNVIINTNSHNPSMALTIID